MTDKNNIGSQSMLSGDFGESFVAYLLAKKGIDVVRASTVGFDLMAKDTKGRIFKNKKIAGISVKARISQQHNKFAPTIPLGSVKTLSTAKRWGVDPYLAVVVGSLNNRLDVFLIPFKEIGGLKGKAIRKDVVAVSQLYKNKKVIKLF